MIGSRRPKHEAWRAVCSPAWRTPQTEVLIGVGGSPFSGRHISCCTRPVGTMLRILVTGHRGYIGSVLTPMLVERGMDVTGLDVGLYDECSLIPDRVTV